VHCLRVTCGLGKPLSKTPGLVGIVWLLGSQATPPVSCSQTALPVPSPVSGVIEELFVPDGEKVNAGDQLCKIRITGVCMYALTR